MNWIKNSKITDELKTKISVAWPVIAESKNNHVVTYDGLSGLFNVVVTPTKVGKYKI